MSVCVGFYVRGFICMCENLQEFLVSQSLSIILLLSLCISHYFLPPSLFFYVVTPLRCGEPEGLVSRRGSDGFSPSLSLEDASISC